MNAVKVWQCEGRFFQAQWPLTEKDIILSVALNTERWKLVPNSHRTPCVCFSISLEMDPDLISSPDGKQREVMEKNSSEEHSWAAILE